MESHLSHRKMIFDGLLIGLVSGFFTLVYRYLLSEIEGLRATLYSLGSFTLLFWILGAAFLGFFIGKLLQIEPLSSGSGIPQVQADILGRVEMNPLKRYL